MTTARTTSPLTRT
jgi:hypothetical protein